MDLVVKREEIAACVLGPSSGSWMYKIIFSEEKSTYKAEVWGYNEDHGYLAEFTCQESSPEFATKQEAETYARKEWVL